MDLSTTVGTLNITDPKPSAKNAVRDNAESHRPEKHSTPRTNIDHEVPATPSLRYTPLNPLQKQIRLLTILIEDSDHLIHCTLSTTSLLSPSVLRYKALSYCWGDYENNTQIIVDGYRVKVTSNLDAALRQLRWRGYVVVWVDAVCVNQGDWVERGSQVQIMQHIYSSAEMVISWVGSAEDDTAEAVKFLLERSSGSLAPPEGQMGYMGKTSDAAISPKSSPKLGYEESHAVEETSLGERSRRILRKRGHLRRTSIRTLLGLSSNLAPPERETVHSSDEPISPAPSPRVEEFRGQRDDKTAAQDSPRYSRLEKAKRKWVRNQWSIVQDFFNQDYWKRVWVIQEVAVATDLKVLYGCSEIAWDNVAAAIVLWKETLMSLPTSHLSHLYAAQLLDLRNRFTAQTPISLLYAMLATNKAMSTDPRDKLFALLGLAFDGPYLVPSPNYEDSMEDILSKLIRLMMVTEKSLDVICIRSQYPPENERLPSWVPPWITNPDFSFWSNSMTILETHLLSANYHFKEIPLSTTTDQSTLVVDGIMLDEIFAITSALNHQTNPLLSVCTTTQCHSTDQDLLAQNITKFYPSGPTNAIWQALCMEHKFHPIAPENEYYSARTVAIYRSCFADLFTIDPTSFYHRRRRRISKPPAELQAWLDENADLSIGNLTLREWSINRVTKTEHTEADMQKFCAILTEILRSGMRLFVSSFGYLGMAPPQSRQGDKLCFLRHCSVPVVLREVDGSEMEYRIVGGGSVRTKFESYAEACVRFARGEPLLDTDPAVHVREFRLV